MPRITFASTITVLAVQVVFLLGCTPVNQSERSEVNLSDTGVYVPLFKCASTKLGENGNRCSNTELAKNINRALQIQFVSAQRIIQGEKAYTFIRPDDSIEVIDEKHALALRNKFKVDRLLVVWGRATDFWKRVVLDLNIRIVKLDHGVDKWKIILPVKGGIEFSVEIPSNLDVGPIILRNEFINEYKQSKELPMYVNEVSSNRIGYLGYEEFLAPTDSSPFCAAQNHGSPKAIQPRICIQTRPMTRMMRSPTGFMMPVMESKEGWIEMTKVSEASDYLMSVVLGIMASIGSDWKNAEILFNNAMKNKEMSAKLKYNLFLLLSYAKEKSGVPGTADIKKALNINPYREKAVSYLLMSHLSKLEKLLHQNDSTHVKTQLNQIGEIVRKYGTVYSENNRWYNDVKIKLTQIESELSRF